MVVKKQTYSTGDSVDMMCSACELEQKHEVRVTTKQGVISEARCEVCDTVTKYSRGEKTSVAVGKGKNAAPYDQARTYKKGQTMMHNTFGRGEVTAADGNKMDVLFGDRTRRMIHSRS